MSRIRITLDDAALKRLEDALAELQAKTRGPAFLKALGKGSAEIAREARQQAKSAVPKSATIGKSIENVKGKYSKPTRPYKVIQHKDKTFETRRIYESYGARHSTNWFKIGHLVAGGADAGTRIAGTSIRAMRAGRDRIKIFRTDGTPAYTRQTDTGKAFIVQGPNGLPHPIKRVRHPGSDAYKYFDKAHTAAGARAIQKFKDDALDVLRNSRERFIQNGFRNT